MKYPLLSLAIICSVQLSAQTFKWDKKGADAGATPQTELAKYEAAYNERQIGLAAEYAPAAKGSTTKYGELYNPAQLTAGHAVLPLGTLVKVTNLENNTSITVRINDSGADCPDCLVVLSDAAAAALGVNLRARVAVERTGFSNWNPGMEEPQPAPKTYGAGTVVARAGEPDRKPVTIEGQAYGWESEATAPAPAPTTNSATVQPAVYNAPAPVPAAPDDASAQSVLAKEVATERALPANPADYAVAKSNEQATGAATQSSPAPTTVAVPLAQEQTIRQAAPPAPTVPKFQNNRTVAAPATYQVPTPDQVAKGATTSPAPVPAPVATTTGTQQGHVVQLAAYANQMYATKRVEEFRNAGMTNVFFRSFRKPDGSTIHRVYNGAFSTRADAQQAADYIRDVHQVAGLVTHID